MKISRFARLAAICCATAACALALAACAGTSEKGPVAATVDGEEIAEQTITDQIQAIRDRYGYSDEDEWGTFLAEQDMTPESVREQYIDSKVDDILLVKGAKELDITVESSEVDEYYDQMKANYSDDAAWNSALTSAGFTADSYREAITQSLYEQKVNEHFEDEVDSEMTDADYVESAQQYAMYYDGAKRSSHILFKVDDATDEAAMAEAKEKAEAVLEQINNGTLDFADAVAQYSDDTGSAQNGGDVGWDLLNSFVTEYTDALDSLELNQVSDLVTSDYGVHIIKVTDVFEAPEDTSTITSLDQIPTEFQTNIKSMAKSIKANTKYQEWEEGLEENADIVINDMPSDVPYNVDMSKYEDDSDDEADADDEEAETESSSASSESSSSSSSESESSSASESESSSASESESSSSSAAA